MNIVETKNKVVITYSKEDGAIGELSNMEQLIYLYDIVDKNTEYAIGTELKIVQDARFHFHRKGESIEERIIRAAKFQGEVVIRDKMKKTILSHLKDENYECSNFNWVIEDICLELIEKAVRKLSDKEVENIAEGREAEGNISVDDFITVYCDYLDVHN